MIELIYEGVVESQEVWEQAAEQQKTDMERRLEIAARLEQPVKARAHNEYEVWYNAMEWLKSYFKQYVDDVNDSTTFESVNLRFKDFGNLSSEKYLTLRENVRLDVLGFSASSSKEKVDGRATCSILDILTTPLVSTLQLY